MSEPAHGTPPSLADRICARLRADILRGRYQPGDRLPSERELADRFETHRGTAREALKQLEQLGLAEISRGGARAAPIEEASLDVVRHLLDLGPTPDPDVFDQLFEVFGALFALSARLMAERADDAQRARAAAILERLMAERLPIAEEFELVQALSEVFSEASHNLVLRLVRKGLHTEVIGRIDQPEALLRPPAAERDALLRRVAAAIAARDGRAAAEAVHAMTQAVRRHAVALLEAERARATEGAPGPADPRRGHRPSAPGREPASDAPAAAPAAHGASRR